MNTATNSSLPLSVDHPEDGRITLNSSVWFVEHDGYRVVFRWQEPLSRVALTDIVHLRLVAVSLRQSQLATQAEIARTFGHAVVTQQRWASADRRHGLKGLEPQSPPGRPTTLAAHQEAFLRRWLAAGAANVEMARRLGVSPSVIHRALTSLGLRRRPRLSQPHLPGLGTADGSAAEPPEADDLPPLTTPTAVPASVAAAVEAPALAAAAPATPPQAPSSSLGEGFTLDTDPRDRSGDRLLARPGLLVDAKPLFAEADTLPSAGVLLAVPLLVQHGLVTAFTQVYGDLRPAFYGLRTIVVTLFVCALLRIKRPEHLKEYRPQDLGRIVGLDRVPEVKTVRRKLARLAALGRGQQLMEQRARQRIDADDERVAFLYIDGHVREYSGKHQLFQAKKAQRQVATAATTDTWVHDAHGEPLLVPFS
jgi:transposase